MRRIPTLCGGGGLVLFAETAFDELDQRLKRSVRFLSLGLDQDRVALPGSKHHQPHDGGAAYGMAFPRHAYGGGVARGATDELSGSPRMQALFVGDHHLGEIEAVGSFLLTRLAPGDLLHRFCHRFEVDIEKPITRASWQRGSDLPR